jgi:hypothetical protein
MENEYVNEYFAKSIGSTRKNLANFVKINTDQKIHENVEVEDAELDYLVHRIAQNMFYFKQNIVTAKTDYVTLIGLLIKKGVVLKEFKDLIPDENYFDK